MVQLRSTLPVGALVLGIFNRVVQSFSDPDDEKIGRVLLGMGPFTMPVVGFPLQRGGFTYGRTVALFPFFSPTYIKITECSLQRGGFTCGRTDVLFPTIFQHM